jgi:hypothetical protein
MFQRIAIALVPVLFCSNVFSAQVYQTLAPGAGQSEVTPYLGLGAAAGETKGTPKVTFTAGVLNLGAKYYYGLAEGQSIGAEVSYSSQTAKATGSGIQDTTIKNKGLTNPTVMYKGLFETASASIYTQLGYKFGIEKEKNDGVTREGNSADGQNTILVNVGVYAPVHADFILGGFVNYEKANDGESTETNNGVDLVSQDTGGDYTTVGVFFEIPTNEYKPNASLSYMTRGSSESKIGGSVISKSDAVNYLMIRGSAQFPIDANMSFNPEIVYQSMLSNDTFDHYGVTAVTANLRMLF